MFDGDMTALGNLSRLWTQFFSNGQGWVSQGTHAERLTTNPGGVPDAGFCIETDRGAIYQSRFVGTAQAWVLVAGFMTGVLAARPKDLGANDSGLFFSATDALDYRWNGTGWTTLDTARGGGALTHVGRLTKVTAAGTLGESAVTDDGSTITSPEKLVIDLGASPANSQIVLRAAGLGALSLICFSTDLQRVDFDQERLNGVQIATNAIVGRIQKNVGKLRFYGAAGQTVGTAIGTTGGPLVLLATLDLATGAWGFGGNAAPVHPVDVTGDANVDGVYMVDGDQVVGPRLAAIAAPTVTTTAVTLTAGGTYTANEQSMLASLKASVNQLNTDVANLEITVNLLRDALRIATGHGLTA